LKTKAIGEHFCSLLGCPKLDMLAMRVYRASKATHILKLFGTVDCPVQATKLQKYVFLLRQETFLGRDSTFYDFCLTNSARTLLRHNAKSKPSQATATLHFWFVSSLDPSWSARGSKRGQRYHTCCACIVSKYGKIGLQPLLKDVYTRYHGMPEQ